MIPIAFHAQHRLENASAVMPVFRSTSTEKLAIPAKLIPIHWEAFKNADLAAQTAPSAIATVETVCSVTQAQGQST